MNDQMIRVISSPSSSTIGFLTLILATGRRCYLADSGRPVGACARSRARMATVERRRLRHPRGHQPAAAARRLQRLRGRPRLVEAVAARAPTGPRSGSPAVGAYAGAPRAAARPARQREPAEAAHPRPLRQPDRRGRVPPRLARAARTGGRARAARARPGASRGPAPTSPAAPPSCACRQAEAGVGCPISMTYSVIPALRTQPELAAEWEPRFLSLDYDPRDASRRPRRPGRSAAWG